MWMLNYIKQILNKQEPYPRRVQAKQPEIYATQALRLAKGKNRLQNADDWAGRKAVRDGGQPQTTSIPEKKPGPKRSKQRENKVWAIRMNSILIRRRALALSDRSATLHSSSVFLQNY